MSDQRGKTCLVCKFRQKSLYLPLFHQLVQLHDGEEHRYDPVSYTHLTLPTN
jgi:hypothetical protein